MVPKVPPAKKLSLSSTFFVGGFAMAPENVHNWRFAPLDPKRENPLNKPKLAGIVFDVDGTLCEFDVG